MAKRHDGDSFYILTCYTASSLEGCQGTSGARNRQLSPMAVHFKSKAKLCDASQQWPLDLYMSDTFARTKDAAALLFLLGFPRGAETRRIALEPIAALDDHQTL